MITKFEIGVSSECPYCKIGTIQLKSSKFGEFYSCSRFPSCAFTQKINEEQTDWLDDIREDIDTNNEDSDLIFK